LFTSGEFARPFAAMQYPGAGRSRRKSVFGLSADGFGRFCARNRGDLGLLVRLLGVGTLGRTAAFLAAGWNYFGKPANALGDVALFCVAACLCLRSLSRPSLRAGQHGYLSCYCAVCSLRAWR
jgi:hypothetical protein